MLEFLRNRVVNLLWESGNYKITEHNGLSHKSFVIRKNGLQELSRINVWFDVVGNSTVVKGIILKNDFIGNRVYKNKLKAVNKALNKLNLKAS